MDSPTPQRTLHLTERRPVEYRLHPADVDFLLAHYQGRLEVLPTRRRHRYRLTSLGHVGTIVAPRCRLVIRPKVPVRNLCYLLDPLHEIPLSADAVMPGSGTEALDFLAGRLVRLLTERVAAGLHRGYAERTDQGPFLQGRLDLPNHLRTAGTRKDQLHSRYEDFSADVPCNQVPRATAELLVNSPLLGADVRAALRHCLQDFAAVRSIALTPEHFAAARVDRLASAYLPLLDLCRLLVDGLAPGDRAGNLACPAFLLDMDQVFEHFLLRSIAERGQKELHRQGYQVCLQPFFQASPPVEGQPDWNMRPDVLLRKDGQAVLVLDAKWKVLPAAALLTGDVYQVLAYGTALGIRRVVLVYPGRRERAWHYDLEKAGVRLTVFTLRVTGARTTLHRSVGRLVRFLGEPN